jgi:ferredoxin
MFSMHAARVSSDVYEVRAGAWECLQVYKQKGYFKAIGIATHSVKTVEAAAMRDDTDIIFPIVNFKGMGILEGTLEEMLSVIKLAYDNGKGLYAMKALAGGVLIGDYVKALSYVRELPYFASIALGMTQESELLTALKVIGNQKLSEAELGSLKASKSLCILPFCSLCGNCIEACPNLALSKSDDGEIVINKEKCVLCGYCVPCCSQFAMRLVNN